MKPKRKDRHFNDEAKQSIDQIQADHEAFLQVFEKPTQIYRFLRTRHLYHPCFMHRNLSYMKGRCTRKINTRANFSLDKLVQAAERREGEHLRWDGLDFTFEGISDPGCGKWNTAEVDAYIVKVRNFRRKATGVNNTSDGTVENLVGKMQLPLSSSQHPDSKTYLSVGAEELDTSHSVHCIKIKVKVRYCSSKRTDSSQGDSPTLPAKRQRRSTAGRAAAAATSDDPAVTHSPVPSIAHEPAVQGQEYTAQMTIVDQKGTRLMTDGEYTLVLTDVGKQQAAAPPSVLEAKAVNPAGRGSWQTVNPAIEPIDTNVVFEDCPTLKFKVSWQTIDKSAKNGVVLKESSISSPTIPYQNGVSTTAAPSSSPTKHRQRRVFYQFLYSNNTGNNNNNGGGDARNNGTNAASARQQTEARSDLTCPWCLLTCPRLYALLKHLRTSHPRFSFLYSEHPKGARIDVSINDHYDGSYSGNPHDLYSYMGFAFCRKKPVQRMCVTQILAMRTPKQSFDLAEFTEQECEDVLRPMVDGHDRLYFHTITHTIQYPSEIDYDSDSELHPMWIRQKTQNLIDDFTDVNEGEKEIMKMWNLHVMHHNFIGDCQLPRACALFIQEYGNEVIAKNLNRNLMLHLINLYDHGLIKPELVHKTMMQLYRLAYKQKVIEKEAVPT